jgi:uncharacterized protein with FMN-binding domain
MKKLVLSLSVIILFAFYSVFQKKVIVGTAAVGKVAADSVSLPVTTANPGIQGQYKDGVYTGGVADAFYGNIQVQATIQGSKITDVIFLQYPNDRNRSISINTQAMPYLRKEAITAQSANVDIVSGATATSQAFIQSLGSALTQAK